MPHRGPYVRGEGKKKGVKIFSKLVVDRDVKFIQIEMAMTNMRNFNGSNTTTRWC